MSGGQMLNTALSVSKHHGHGISSAVQVQVVEGDHRLLKAHGELFTQGNAAKCQPEGSIHTLLSAASLTSALLSASHTSMLRGRLLIIMLLSAAFCKPLLLCLNHTRPLPLETCLYLRALCLTALIKQRHTQGVVHSCSVYFL